jgi:hypothetical protein
LVADTRQALLQRLLAGYATEAAQAAYLGRLADFMADFIRHRLAMERGDGALNLGDPATMQWTVLALLRPGDLYDQICADLRRLLRSADDRDRPTSKQPERHLAHGCWAAPQIIGTVMILALGLVVV